jgi:serralysin
MATLIYGPALPVAGPYTVAFASSTNIQLQSGRYSEFYTGQFVLGVDNVTGGTLTGILAMNFAYTTPVVLTVSDFAIPAAPFAAAMLAGDGEAALQMLLAGNDSIRGAANNDFIRGLDGDDTVDGGSGNDDLNGNKGADSVYGGVGDDWVRGGQGNDTVLGDEGNDGHVNGNLGDDSVSGGAGNDTCYGGQGADSISGGDGNDLLSGDLGDDVLLGGAGADRYAIAVGGGFDWASFVAAEGDRIQLAAGTAYTVTSVSNQVVIELTGGARLGLAGVASGSFSSDWIVFG